MPKIIFQALLFLIRFILSYIPKIRLLACLILEIAMKKTLDQALEDDFKIIFFFFHSTYLLIMLISSYIPKIIILACLILEIAMKKTLKLGFGRRPYNILNFFLHISSSQVKVKLHAENQLPMCPGSGLKVCGWWVADTKYLDPSAQLCWFWLCLNFKLGLSWIKNIFSQI